MKQRITYSQVINKNINNFANSIKEHRANHGTARTLVFIIPLIYLFSLFEWLGRLILNKNINE